MKNHILAVLTLGLGLLPASRAGAEEGILVTLNNVGGQVRSQNPDLAAARLRIDEALGLLRQSGRLDNPELGIGVSHDNRFRERTFEVGFSQRFPVTNRLRLEKKISVAQLQAAEAEIRNVERHLVADARTALVKVLAIREQRTLRRGQLGIAEELAKFTREASKLGELSAVQLKVFAEKQTERLKLKE